MAKKEDILERIEQTISGLDEKTAELVRPYSQVILKAVLSVPTNERDGEKIDAKIRYRISKAFSEPKSETSTLRATLESIASAVQVGTIGVDGISGAATSAEKYLGHSGPGRSRLTIPWPQSNPNQH